jgi:hypothetical protein
MNRLVIYRPLDILAEIEFLRREAEGWIIGAAPGSWQFPNAARQALFNGTFDLDTDSFRVALFTSSSNLGSGTTTYASTTGEVANGNGYTTGGVAVTLTLSGSAPVTVDFATEPTWTASGGPIVARYAAIYEVGGLVLCYCLLDATPADITIPDGMTFTLATGPNGIFQVSFS